MSNLDQILEFRSIFKNLGQILKFRSNFENLGQILSQVYEVPGIRYLVHGTRHLDPGTCYLILGTWPGTGYQVLGSKFQVLRTWYQVYLFGTCGTDHRWEHSEHARNVRSIVRQQHSLWLASLAASFRRRSTSSWMSFFTLAKGSACVVATRASSSVLWRA